MDDTDIERAADVRRDEVDGPVEPVVKFTSFDQVPEEANTCKDGLENYLHKKTYYVNFS
jgi:acyl-CoA reductase-like NAD-dependent aldehyde dehydrogenase